MLGPWGWEDPLEKGTATHSSILENPRTEEPGGLHLKEILPVFKLTHISEFSNSLTSAVDSLCSHGFTYTSV